MRERAEEDQSVLLEYRPDLFIDIGFPSWFWLQGDSIRWHDIVRLCGSCFLFQFQFNNWQFAICNAVRPRN